MAQEIKYSIHRSPLKDADGNDTYQIRQEVGSVLNEKWMTSHLKEHNNLMAKYIEQALLVIEDEIECNLLSNNRLHIEGLGTFYLKLGFREQTDEEGNSIKPRITVLGHIQRGGSPTGRDRETATRMGYHAVTAMAEGRMNCIIATQEGSIVEIPIEEALQREKHLQMDRYKIMEVMQVGGFVDIDL